MDNAIKFTSLAVNHKEHNTNTIYYLGALYLKAKDIDNSAECFKKVLSKKKNNLFNFFFFTKKFYLLKKEEDSSHIPSLIEYATI